MAWKRILQGIALVWLGCSSLSGCSGYKYVWPDVQPLPGTKSKGVLIGAATGGVLASSMSGTAPVALAALAGGVVGGSLGDYLSEREGFVDKLDVAGVTVAVIGEDIKIVLPADRFLYSKSTKINPQYYPVVDGIADMIRFYDKKMVKVSGFTDDKGCRIENLALSREQAQSIANYLMRHRLDARLIYSVGYGDTQTVSSNLSMRGRAENRRIEITLRRMPEGALV